MTLKVKTMEHAIFVEKYRANEIVVSVDKYNAGFMYENPYLMPLKLRAQQASIRTVAFSGVILGVALFFFVLWWLALGVLFVGLFMFSQAQRSAAKGVLEASLQDPSVYQVAIDNQVLIVKDTA